MKPAEIIRDIHQHGGKVNVEGDDLTLIAPRPLPADLLQQLREHKVEVLAFLTEDAANNVANPASKARRQQALSMLAQEPGITHAIVRRRSRTGCRHRDAGDSWQSHMRTSHPEGAIRRSGAAGVDRETHRRVCASARDSLIG
jgi:hypothetical protein